MARILDLRPARSSLEPAPGRRDGGGPALPAAHTPRRPLNVELVQAAAVKLWGLYRRDLITYEELDRSLTVMELEAGFDITVCEKCHARHATVIDPIDGRNKCGACINRGRTAEGGSHVPSLSL